MTAADYQRQVAEVLAGAYPSYHEPLRVAWRWNRDGDDRDVKREAATRLLAGLRDRDHYPTALQVWYEAAFNFMNRNMPDQALALLTEMDRRFGGRLDADTHALFGKYYKKLGHAHLEAGLKAAGADERAAELVRADLGYAAALTQYERGYALDRDHFHGINTAFLLFMQAAMASQLQRPADAVRLLKDARDRADEVLKTAGKWAKKLPDDDVWHAATRGEAHALRGEWPEAVRAYRAATDWLGLQDHHREAMGEQLDHLARGYVLLATVNPGATPDLAAQLPKLAEFLTPQTPVTP